MWYIITNHGVDQVTTGSEQIELSRFVRDVRVFHRGSFRDANGRPQTAGGILRPFSGVLGLEPWRSEWPLPALSFLRLTPQVLPTLRETRWSPSRVEEPDTPEREASERSEGDDDSSDEEVRVRDLLSMGSRGLDQSHSDGQEETSSPEVTTPGPSGLESPRIPRSSVDDGPGPTRVRTRRVNDRDEGRRSSMGVRRHEGAETDRSTRNVREKARGETASTGTDHSERSTVGTWNVDRFVEPTREGGREGSGRSDTGESMRWDVDDTHVDPPTRTRGVENRQETNPVVGNPTQRWRGRDTGVLRVPPPSDAGERGATSPRTVDVQSITDTELDTALVTDPPSMEPLRGVIGASTGRSWNSGSEGGQHGQFRSFTGSQPSRRRADGRFSRRGTTSNSPRRGDSSNGDRSRRERRTDPSEPRHLDELVDVDRLADRLARAFERKARIERERRGR